MDCSIACAVERLSSSSDAASRACHDLYDMILALTGPDLFHKLAGVAKSIRNGHIKSKAVKVNCGGPYAVNSPDFLEIYLWKRFVGVEFVCCSQRGLKYTACGSEDSSGSGTFSQRIVK